MKNSLGQTILQIVIAAIVTGLIGWATWATALDMKQETRIAVTETQLHNVDQSLSELKDGQKEMSKKLDRLIERVPTRPAR